MVVGGLAGCEEDAVAVGGAGVAKVIVEVALVVAASETPQVAAELFEPTGADVVGVDLGCFGVDYLGLLDGDTAYHYRVDVEAGLLAGPSVADKLRAEVPGFGPPLADATPCCFLVADYGSAGE